MANWSDCYIEINGSKEAVEAAKKKFTNDEYSDVNIIDEGDDYINISLSGKWYGPRNIFKGICERYKASGKYTDAEAGNDFFVFVEYINGEEITDIEETYLCDKSIEEYGRQYFIEYYADQLEIDDAVEVAKKLCDEEDEQDYLEVISYICSEDVEVEMLKVFPQMFSDLPSMGESQSNPVSKLQIDENLFVVEAEKVHDFKYVTTVFNLQTKEWQSVEVTPTNKIVYINKFIDEEQLTINDK